MPRVLEDLLSTIEKQGYKSRVVSAQHVFDLKKRINETHGQGQLDDEFYQERLTHFDFRIPDGLPDDASLIVVAAPRPQNQVRFTWQGQVRSLLLPPTYVAYEQTRRTVEDLLAHILTSKDARAGSNPVVPAKLPLKLLATQSGLGTYGRNNICYVSGMGSFLQLVAVYSNLPCERDPWQEPQMMKRCETCHACQFKCPTGAISPDRFLLHAHKCLVYHNEKPGNIPFPSWIDTAWHNCVVGCLHCQTICPENRNLLHWIEGNTEFSEEETTLLVNGVPQERLPKSTIEKLKDLDLIEYFGSLARNLGVFFQI